MTDTNTTPKKIGRPPFPGAWSRRHVYLSDEMYERFKRIGLGSPSRGLRLIVERYDKLRAKGKKKRPPKGDSTGVSSRAAMSAGEATSEG